jgi:esterase/lipase
MQLESYLQEKSMKLKFFSVFFVFILILPSCSTQKKSVYDELLNLEKNTNPIHEQYPNMKIVDYGNNKAYEFKNENADTLAIIIEGSGFMSVLGWEENNQFQKGGLWFYLLELFKSDCSVLVLEKMNFEFGKYYRYNINTRRTYTLENLVMGYSEIVNKYLSENSYSKVVLIGSSEGACVLPRVYMNISNNNISGMVSVAYGGLSRYEHLKIIANSQLEGINDTTKEAFSNIDLYKEDVKLYPNSIGELFDYPYAWLNSVLDYRPFDDYKKINIPVLFIHGELDISVPVESTRYIQDNLPDKPFEYLIYPDADHHSFMFSEKTFYDLVNRSRGWLNGL